jgi:NAD-dependent dihydropyrimidine dehydrogenase PreA subunit
MYFKDSSCNSCIDICPIENTFKKEDYKITLNEEHCIGCGACFSICPTGAFEFPNFSIYKLIQELEKISNNSISCKLNIPCLAVLSSQDLISLALKLEKDVLLDIAHCENCQIGKLKEKYIDKNIEEANYFLENLGVSYKVRGEKLNISVSNKSKEKENRRGFLKKLGKLSLGLTFWSIAPNLPIEEKNEEETKPIKDIVAEKVLPEKRKMLLEFIKDKELDLKDKKVEVEKISFTSDKWIEFSKCTNCSICYNVCPTGALKGIDNRTKILFEPSLCVKCKVCHEVCPENCLHLEKELEIEYFVYGEKILAEHIMIQCAECLIPFSYKGDTTICPRCQKLEDEIKEMLEF